MVEFTDNDFIVLNLRLKSKGKLIFIFPCIMTFFWFVSAYWGAKTGTNAVIHDMNYFSALLYSSPIFLIPILLVWYYSNKKLKEFKEEVRTGLKERIRGKVIIKKSNNWDLYIVIQSIEGGCFKLLGYGNNLRSIEKNDMIWVTYLPKSKYIIRIKKV